MHYHKTGVPWQMKSTFIIVTFLLELPGMPCFARVSGVIVNALKLQIVANQSRIKQVVLPVSSKIGSKREMVTTKGFAVPSASAQILHPILSRHTTHHFLIYCFSVIIILGVI